MIEFINEAYVKGILDDVVAGSQRLSRDDFYAACRHSFRRRGLAAVSAAPTCVRW
jgi:hypothetical protein